MIEKNNSTRLEDALQRRREPETPPWLAQRIISAAADMPQHVPGRMAGQGFYGRVQAWLDQWLALPQPAVAFSVCLIAGAVLGIEAENLISASAQYWPDMTAILFIGEDWI